MVINSEILEPRQAARISPAWNPRSVALHFVLANDLIGKAELRSNNAQHNIFWIAHGAVGVLLCLATKGELRYRGHRAHALDRSASRATEGFTSPESPSPQYAPLWGRTQQDRGRISVHQWVCHAVALNLLKEGESTGGGGVENRPNGAEADVPLRVSGERVFAAECLCSVRSGGRRREPFE
jgi:hypothetical protein